MKKKILVFITFTSVFFSYIHAQADFVWGKQFGTDQEDKARSLVSDPSGNVYVVGKTDGKLGSENFGKSDGFIVKIDTNANIVWTKQIGSKEDDDLVEVVTDKSGNLYITGFIGVDNRKSDILVIKLSGNGEIVWQKQFGSDSPDIGENIAIDSKGYIYITGETKGIIADKSNGGTDCFILQLDNNGNKLNAIQFGTSGNDAGYGISIGNDSNIYICGTTEGNLAAVNMGKSDMFWGTFTSDLLQVFLKQFGTSEYDSPAKIISDDEGNVYVGGSTGGIFDKVQKGNGDGFLMKLDKKGNLFWASQFGTKNWDGVNGLAFINDKIVTNGCLNYPECQSFCRMYSKNGSLLWDGNIIAKGEGGGTCGKEVNVNQSFIYHAGYTGASLFSGLKGKHDLFLVKLKLDVKNY